MPPQMAAILGVASGRGSPRRIPPTYTPAPTFSGDSLPTENPFEPLRRRETKYSVTDNISFLGCFTHTELYKVYQLEGPQRQGVESCRILSRPGSVNHLKALSCASLHDQWFLVLSRSLSGLDSSAIWGWNLFN